jgi:haloalkane dehalogenase
LRLRFVRNLSALATPAVLYGNLFARAAVHMAPRKQLSVAVKQGLLAPYDSPLHRLATLRFVQDIPLVPGDDSFDIVDNVDRHIAMLSKNTHAGIVGTPRFRVRYGLLQRMVPALSQRRSAPLR